MGKAAALLAGLLLGAAGARGHAFAVCPGTTDHLHVSAINIAPDPPVPGKALQASVSLTPEADFAGGKVDVAVKVLGIKVASVEMDACKYISCPIKAGKTATLSVSQDLPSEVPAGVEAAITISVVDLAGNKLSCIVTKIDTSFSEAQDADEVLGEVPALHETNKLAALYQRWLEQYHQLAELTWYPIHGSEDASTKDMKQRTRLERFVVFAENLRNVMAHNKLFRSGHVKYAKSLNQFAHLSAEEFGKTYLGGFRRDLQKESGMAKKAMSYLRGKVETLIRLPQSVAMANSGVAAQSYPDEVDWTTKGAVTPVKNQGSCGSCWAFSTIASLEGAYFLKYGQLKSFSEQQLVSCDGTCQGCGGGLMDLGFEWIHENGGICGEDEYPYTSGNGGVNGFCRPRSCSPDPKSVVQSYVDVEHTDEALMEAVAQTPVSVAIEADQFAFQFYSHGVMTGECGDHLDHGVLLVGYGSLDGTLYWKLKNSWGGSWGMDGYILIEKGKITPAQDEECGILLDASYPVL